MWQDSFFVVVFQLLEDSAGSLDYLVVLNNQISFKLCTSFLFVFAIFCWFLFLFSAPAAYFETNNISLPHWEGALGMGGWPRTGASLAPRRQSFGIGETQQHDGNGTGAALQPSRHISPTTSGAQTAQREQRDMGAVIVFGMAITVITLFCGVDLANPDGNELDWVKAALICWRNYWWFEKPLPFLAHRRLSHPIFVVGSTEPDENRCCLLTWIL